MNDAAPSSPSQTTVGQFPSLDALLEHGDWLRQLARSLMNSDADAQDLEQDTWAAAAKSPPPDGVEPRSWLTGIARNIRRNGFRKGARRRNREAAVQATRSTRGADEEVHELEQQRHLLKALMGIPEAQRKVVMARYYDDETPRRIAARLGLPIATVKSQIQRGLHALKKELDEAYGDRRSWTVALTPLAYKASGTGAILGGAWILWPVVTAAIAALVAWLPALLGWDRLSSIGENRAPAEAILGSSAAAEVAATSLAAITPQEKARALVDPSAAPEEKITIRARLRGAGSPVADFEGWIVDMAALQPKLVAAGVEINALEEVKPYATLFASNDSGEAMAAAGGPFLAVVTSGDYAGMGFTESALADGSEWIMDLVRAPILEIRLSDKSGALIPEDTHVRFEALVPYSGSGIMGAGGYLDTPSEYDWEEQDVLIHRGKGEVRLALSHRNPEQPIEAVRSVQTRSFRVNAPGVLEFARSSIAYLDGVNEPVMGGPQVIKLTCPSLGSLQLEVRDASGALLAVEGRADMTFQATPAGLAIERYPAKIRDGVATWPLVAAGGHPMTFELTVPSLGKTWKMEGIGPGADGEKVVLGARPPAAHLLSARVLNADRQSLAGNIVHLVHGIRGNQVVEGKTDASGNARFEIPEVGLDGEPIVIQLFNDTECIGYKNLNLSPEQRKSGGDLGDVVMTMPPRTTILGVLQTPNGRLTSLALVSVTRGGRGLVSAFTSDGTFKLAGHFDEEETISVRIAHPGERQYTMDQSRQPDAVQSIRPHDLSGPISLEVLPPLASKAFRASVDAAGMGIHPNDIQVRNGGEVLDPRLQGIQLHELVRSIRVGWKTTADPDTGEPRPPMLVSFQPEVTTEAIASGAITAVSCPPFDLIIPRDLPGTIRIHAAGFLSRTLNARDVGESLLLDLAPGLEQTIKVTGTPPTGAEFRLRLTSSHGWQSAVSLPKGLELGEEWTGHFPEPGDYRLERRLRESREGWVALLPLIHIHPSEPDHSPQSLDLSVETPLITEAVNR